MPVIPQYWAVSEEFKGNITDKAKLKQDLNDNYNTISQLTAHYNFNLNEEHNFNLLGGMSQEYFKYRYINGGTEEYNQLGIMVIGDLNKDKEYINGRSNDLALRSYFGRVNYNYKEKYLFEANFRADASSRFAPENRWGYFPSFSVGWVVSKESFLSKVDAISNLEVRASWGELGNQSVGSYNLYESSIASGSLSNYTFNNSVATGTAITQFSNPDAVWEVLISRNIGLDVSFLKNKLFAEIDVYSDTREGQLYNLDLPSIAGDLSGPTQNIAEVDINGWETNFGYRNQIGDLKFSVSVNLSHSGNKIVALSGTSNDDFEKVGDIRINKVGSPMNSYFLFEQNGLIMSDAELAASPTFANTSHVAYVGDYLYVDQNGDNMIDNTSLDDKIIIDSAYPDLIYGFNINLEYKGFDFALMAHGVTGFKVYGEQQGVDPFEAQSGIPQRWVDESISFNPNGTLPRFTHNWVTSISKYKFYRSTANLFDADFLRIKNIQLGYTFPERIISKVNLSGLRVYVNASNPFVFTKMIDGVDPEKSLVNLDDGGKRLTTMPTVSILSAGLNINF